jgi:hypothetical protein
MGNMFKKPKVPDTTAQTERQIAIQERGVALQETAAKKQEEILAKQEERATAQEQEKSQQLTSRRRASRGGGAGMRALLSTERANPETGLSTTLGTGTRM